MAPEVRGHNGRGDRPEPPEAPQDYAAQNSKQFLDVLFHYRFTCGFIFFDFAEMAESAAGQYEDQFICPVCLDRLKEPVTIPCGHSYCMSCITDCWEQKEQEPPYRCPQCRESFSQRPLLKKNTLIDEMMDMLQKMSLQTAAVERDVKHKLDEASRGIPKNICLIHKKPLDIYCRDDGQCICYLCMIDKHNGHSMVPVDSEWTSKK
ncbi:hypothetical protein M9458_031009, partial [Cirrhinus mrigala]